MGGHLPATFACLTLVQAGDQRFCQVGDVLGLEIPAQAHLAGVAEDAVQELVAAAARRGWGGGWGGAVGGQAGIAKVNALQQLLKVYILRAR